METVELILRIIASTIAGAAAIGLIYSIGLVIQAIKNLSNPKE